MQGQVPEMRGATLMQQAPPVQVSKCQAQRQQDMAIELEGRWTVQEVRAEKSPDLRMQTAQLEPCTTRGGAPLIPGNVLELPPRPPLYISADPATRSLQLVSV